MNILLLTTPANLTGKALRQLLLETFGGNYDADTDTWHDNNPNVMIPNAGTSPGTKSSGGKQVVQLMSWWSQPQIESLLEDAGLNQYKVIAFQTFEEFLVPDSDPPVYKPNVTTNLENGSLAYLQDRGGQTKQYDWFSNYAGASVWQGL